MTVGVHLPLARHRSPPTLRRYRSPEQCTHRRRSDDEEHEVSPVQDIPGTFPNQRHAQRQEYRPEEPVEGVARKERDRERATATTDEDDPKANETAAQAGITRVLQKGAIFTALTC